MGTEETKSTNSTTENNVTTTQKVAYGEEKIKADEEEEEEEGLTSREKKPADAPTTSAEPELKIEEEKNVAIVTSNPPPVPSPTREDSDEIKIQTYSEPTPIAKKEDDKESLSMKAHHAEESVLDVVDAVGAKVGSFAKKKFGEIEKSLNPSYMSAVQDSRKIEALGPMVEELVRVFEDTTTMIRNVPYEEQVDLLIGYKKMIEEQIKVIDSRINMSKRLK